MAIIDFGIKSIGSFLKDKNYFIPSYQREYAWDANDQISDFWQDLESSCKESTKQFFFGQIVVHKDGQNGDRYFIIDGQQRITTSIIYLAVIRDLFKQYQEDNAEAKYQVNNLTWKYIGQWTPSRDELTLHLGETDFEFFRDNIQLKYSQKTTSFPSQKRILAAYSQLKSCVENQLEKEESIDDKVNRLVALQNVLLEKFVVMAIVTDDINEAFIIFETLNARGKDLETSDLLKNYIFMKSSSSIEAVKTKWMKMVDTLDKREDTTKLIRYFWNSTHDFVREKALYKTISSDLKPSKCEEFITTLIDVAELYNGLISPDEHKYFDKAEINDSLSALSIMGASTYIPVLIASHIKALPEDSIQQIVSAIEVLAFRNFVVAGLTANKYEVFFAKLAKEIFKDSLPVEDIIKRISEETISDEKFKSDLVGFETSSKKTTITKYILRKIEDYSSPEKKMNKDNKAINLEHIMPQNNSIWGVDPDIHARYVNRLANQTLLLEEYNKSVSNKKFDTKKTVYQKSSVRLTKELCNYSQWGKDEIEEREQKLITQIMEVWKKLA